jgi:hypothetical protein
VGETEWRGEWGGVVRRRFAKCTPKHNKRVGGKPEIKGCMDEVQPIDDENREIDQSFGVASFRTVEWWAQQFISTQNCQPGEVLLVFTGSAPIHPIAASWFVAAWCIRTKDDTPAFRQIVHIVPPPLRGRDFQANLCASVKETLAIEKQNQDSQDQGVKACASRCFATIDGTRIADLLQDLPEFSAVAISCADLIRYPEFESSDGVMVTTHTGLRVGIEFDEKLTFSHLYRFVGDTLKISAERKLSIVIFAGIFGPSTQPFPKELLAAENLAIYRDQRPTNGKSLLDHVLAAEQIRKKEGIDAARRYVEQVIPDVADRTITTAGLLSAEGLFSGAWQELIPQLAVIRQRAESITLLNLAQSAIAAGAAKEALDFLKESWEAGLEKFESLNSAALVAKQLSSDKIWGEIIDAMVAVFPEHPLTLARHYEWLYQKGSFTEAAIVAKKAGRILDAHWCDLQASPQPQWEPFLAVGMKIDRVEETLLLAATLALERGQIQEAQQFIERSSKNSPLAPRRIQLWIDLLEKRLATAKDEDLAGSNEILDEIFDYVARQPENVDLRQSLVQLFEVSLPDMTAIIILAKRCHVSFGKWQELAPDNPIGYENEPLNSNHVHGSIEEAQSFMESIYKGSSTSTVIGLGDVPKSFHGSATPVLLKGLGNFLTLAGQKQDIKFLKDILHSICIVCRASNNSDSDYVAGLYVMGVLISAGAVQDALNLCETMLRFWPATQPPFELMRKSHGWAAMSDSYLRAHNPITALLHLCLSVEVMAQANTPQNIVLFRHKLRLAARVFRTLGLMPLGRPFLEMERAFVEMFPTDKKTVAN